MLDRKLISPQILAYFLIICHLTKHLKTCYNVYIVPGHFATQQGDHVTEQEKNERRFIVVSALVILIVAITSGFIWRWTAEPMKPQVIEFATSTHVRWGNRFNPFVYEVVDYIGTEKVRLPSGTFSTYTTLEGEKVFKQIGVPGTPPGWHRINELPPDAYRRLFEAQIILKEYREKQKSAAPRAADGPAITER